MATRQDVEHVIQNNAMQIFTSHIDKKQEEIGMHLIQLTPLNAGLPKSPLYKMPKSEQRAWMKFYYALAKHLNVVAEQLEIDTPLIGDKMEY